MAEFRYLQTGTLFSLDKLKFIKINNNLDTLFVTKEELPHYSSNCFCLENQHYCTILPTIKVKIIKSSEMFH